jgi:hypothetical protein
VARTRFNNDRLDGGVDKPNWPPKECFEAMFRCKIFLEYWKLLWFSKILCFSKTAGCLNTTNLIISKTMLLLKLVFLELVETLDTTFF